MDDQTQNNTGLQEANIPPSMPPIPPLPAVPPASAVTPSSTSATSSTPLGAQSLSPLSTSLPAPMADQPVSSTAFPSTDDNADLPQHEPFPWEGASQSFDALMSEPVSPPPGPPISPVINEYAGTPVEFSPDLSDAPVEAPAAPMPTEPPLPPMSAPPMSAPPMFASSMSSPPAPLMGSSSFSGQSSSSGHSSSPSVLSAPKPDNFNEVNDSNVDPANDDWQLPPASPNNPNDLPLTQTVDAPAPLSSPLPPAFPFSPTPRPAGPADHPIELPLGGEVNLDTAQNIASLQATLATVPDVSAMAAAPAVQVAVMQTPATQAAIAQTPPAATVSASVPVASVVSSAVPLAANSAPMVEQEKKKGSSWIIWAIVVAAGIIIVGALYFIGRGTVTKNVETDPLLLNNNTPVDDSFNIAPSDSAPSSGTILP